MNHDTVENYFYGACQLIQNVFERRRKLPVDVAREQSFERFGGNDIFDAQGNYDYTLVYGAFDFFANLRRVVGAI